jgi:hypothetical protein
MSLGTSNEHLFTRCNLHCCARAAAASNQKFRVDGLMAKTGIPSSAHDDIIINLHVLTIQAV